MRQEAAAKRQLNHSQMKNLMHEGQLPEALEFAKQTVEKFGPHIGLLCDIAACQYELGEYQACAATAKFIEKEFQRVSHYLSASSSRKTNVFLSKLFEEFGEIHEALGLLKTATEFAVLAEENKIIQSQELRILSYFGQKKELTKKYLLLTESIVDDQNLQIEIFHGLLWAEYSLFGFSHALQRWNRLKGMDVNMMDRRLMASDFLEICLLAGQKDHSSALEAAEVLQVSNPFPYDLFLIKLQNGSLDALNPLGSDEFPTMTKFRILSLQMAYVQDPSHVWELRRKFLFLAEGLGEASNKIVLTLLPPIKDDKKILRLSERLAEFDSTSIKLTQFQYRLLNAFREKTSLTLEEAGKILWDEIWDEGHYHRLRMLTYKINDLFQLNLGAALLDIRKSGIVLHHSIKIEK